MTCIFARISVILFSLSCLGSALAAPTADQLLPGPGTKAFVSIANAEEFSSKFDETQLGQLLKDPVLQPFLEDARLQIRQKLMGLGIKLGITREDLKGLCTGELAYAALQPIPKDKNSHAGLLIATIAGKEAELTQVLNKVAANLTTRKTTRTVKKLGAADVVTYTFPLEQGETVAETISYLVLKERFILSDKISVIEEVANRLNRGGDAGSLAQHPAYRVTMERSVSGGQTRESAGTASQVRWYVEPLGLAEVIRAQAGGKKRKGTDILKVLARQGFNAVQGIGGQVFLKTNEHEALHRSFVYAPAADRKLAMKVAEFPNTPELTAQSWIPADVASYATFNWNLKDRFESVKTLVDEIVGEEGVFEDVLLSLEKDPAGPRINIRKELVANAKQRATLVTDYRHPITPQSERWLIAMEVANEQAVAAGLRKLFMDDPSAKERKERGITVWEIKNSKADEGELAIAIPGSPMGSGFVALGAGGTGEAKLPNSAFTVMDGHVVMASHVDFVVELLKRSKETPSLSESIDYQRVNAAISQLGAGSDSFRFFARTDETTLPTFELIRQGKMPEAETLLAKTLNTLIPHKEGTLRQQEIDGSKLPEFEKIRHYLGPAGGFVRTEENGWLIVGCVLKRDAAPSSDVK